MLIHLWVITIYFLLSIVSSSLQQLAAVRKIVGDTPIEFMPHEEMKKDLSNTKAFVRTGEETPYSNILLESGVVF